MERLSYVIRLLALTYPLSGPTVVAEALLLRSMQFKRIVGIEVLSYVSGYGLVGITMAALGFGVWALVAATLCQAVVKVVGFALAGSLRVGLSLNGEALKQLLNFGAGFSLAKIANYAANQGDYLFVGRCLGAEALGIYGRAYQFLLMPTNLVGGVVDRVLFPAMAEVQNDKRRLAEAYSRAVSFVAMITLPASAALFALAPQIVRVLLGPRWDAVVPPFRILAVILVFRTSYKMSDSLSRATGAVYRRAWRQWVYAGAVFVGSWLGHFGGVSGVAAGVAIAVVLNFILMFELSMRLIPLSLRALVGIHVRYLVIGLLAGVAAWSIAHVLQASGSSEWVSLFGGCMGAMGALIILVFLWKDALGCEGRWAWSLVKSRLQRTSSLVALPMTADFTDSRNEG